MGRNVLDERDEVRLKSNTKVEGRIGTADLDICAPCPRPQPLTGKVAMVPKPRTYRPVEASEGRRSSSPQSTVAMHQRCTHLSTGKTVLECV